MNKAIDSVLLSFGLLYLSVALIRPQVLESILGFSVPVWASALTMVVMGGAIIISLYTKNIVFLVILGVFEAMACMINWTGLVEWSLLMNQSVALGVMALMDWFASIAFFSKAWELKR